MSELTIPCPDWYQSILKPSTVHPPCGESLEYDSAFLMLQSHLQPRLGAEYGDFVEAIEPINWPEIEREASALLVKSKDVRLVIMLIRCRMRQVGVSALCEGIEALLCLLETWPEALHPQLYDEGEYIPIIRANAFAEMESVEGLMSDFRQQMLPRATGLQLSVRDVEKASTFPREEGAHNDLTMNAVRLSWQQEPAIVSLQLAAQRLTLLTKRLRESLGEDAPEFNQLQTLLGYFGSAPAAAPAPEITDAAPVIESTVYHQKTAETMTVSAAQINPLPASLNSVSAPRAIESRADALNRLREVRSWFSQTEPSSPVICLLAFTEKTIGKSFTELLQFLPQELISRLEPGQGEGQSS